MGLLNEIEKAARSDEWIEREKRADGPTASQKIFSYGLRGLEGIMRRMDHQEMLEMENIRSEERSLRHEATKDARKSLNDSRRRLSSYDYSDNVGYDDDDFDFGF